jgi:hypothetical protein
MELCQILFEFSVEAVWKQAILPPHLSNISTSKRYKAIFTLSGGWRQNQKKFLGEEILVIFHLKTIGFYPSLYLSL